HSPVIEGQNGLATRSGAWISPAAFEMLGVAPLLGRTFIDGEGRPGTEDRVIISESVWRREYASDPGMIGRRVQLSGEQATVVAVMPRAFHFPYWMTEVWRPYDLAAPPPSVARRPIMTYARVRAGIPLDDAARLATIAASAGMPLENGRRVILRGVAAGFLDQLRHRAPAGQKLAAGRRARSGHRQ